MSDYTEELLRNMAVVGNAGWRLMNTAPVKKQAPAQQLVLDILAEEDGLTQGVLAEILDIRPSSLTEVLNKLESRGEIRRQEDPKDKRIKQVYITESGRQKATPESERLDRSEEFFAGLSQEDQQQLNQLLNKIMHGWANDFCDLSAIPRSAFEALDSLKEFRKQFDGEFMGMDLEGLSTHERRQMKRAMKDQLRQQFRRRSPGRTGFSERPFEGNAAGQADKGKTSDESEWDNW